MRRAVRRRASPPSRPPYRGRDRDLVSSCRPRPAGRRACARGIDRGGAERQLRPTRSTFASYAVRHRLSSTHQPDRSFTAAHRATSASGAITFRVHLLELRVRADRSAGSGCHGAVGLPVPRARPRQRRRLPEAARQLASRSVSLAWSSFRAGFAIGRSLRAKPCAHGRIGVVFGRPCRVSRTTKEPFSPWTASG